MVPKIWQIPCGLRIGTQVGERTGQNFSICHGQLRWWHPSHTLHRRRDNIIRWHKDRAKQLLWRQAKCYGGMSPLQQKGVKTVRSHWLSFKTCTRLQKVAIMGPRKRSWSEAGLLLVWQTTTYQNSFRAKQTSRCKRPCSWIDKRKPGKKVSSSSGRAGQAPPVL